MLLAATDKAPHGCKASQYGNRSILQVLALMQRGTESSLSGETVLATE